MGVFKWNWNKVRAGQVITFRYNGKERIVMVLSSPRDAGTKDKKLLHGLQLGSARGYVSGIGGKLREFCRYTDGVIFLFNDPRTGSYFKFAIGTQNEDRKKPDAFYNQMKSLIKKKDLYKTFSWDKCTDNNVRLDNNEVNEQNLPPEYLAQAGILGEQKQPPVKPIPRVFRRKAKSLQYKPGDVWKRPSGRWASKNAKGEVKSFPEKTSALIWARKYDFKQLTRMKN